MARTTRRTPAGQAGALACRSAVLLLRTDPATALTSGELAPHLASLLGAVSRELEVDQESVPPRVRCAAVQLAAHIVGRSSISEPRIPGDAEEPLEHPAPGADHATGIPFSRSIRLGRMG
jgi:hypothetical protein